ncbi:MAG: hypothetical protein HY540_07365, partial [Deltaproteobacteria bacterium]|nr:hypothetical protein [Deltaproteobacteria bacterium]
KDARGLVALAQMGVLEIHPWGSRADNIEHPDTMIFDLDPSPGVAWKQMIQTARDVKKVLDHLHLTSFLKVTGGKGLHVVAPIKPKRNWDELKEYSREIAKAIVEMDPEVRTLELRKQKRVGKIYVDFLRNGRGATAIAPYSPRALRGALIAMPISWRMLGGDLRPNQNTVQNITAALKRSDPWKDFFSRSKK